MKLCFVSDTHGLDYDIDPCDIVCHTGDATNRGSEGELIDFKNWFMHVEAPVKLFVPGNHDFICEKEPIKSAEILAKGDILMLDSKVYEVNGIKFYGHPWVPQFYDWAFMPTLAERQAWIDQIPEDTDILLCHGPPYGILDHSGRMNCGDRQLADKILEVNPKICAFGHIHEDFGYKKVNDTMYINSALGYTGRYYKLQTPIYVELDENNKIDDIYFHED